MSEAPLFVATTFTEIYERALVGPLFRPFAEQLLASVAPNRGDSVIDIACGTGIVARVARERLGPERGSSALMLRPRCSPWHVPLIRRLTGVTGTLSRFQ